MAVRFDADGEDYTRALALGTQTALTVSCWFKVSVDRNTWSTVFSIDNGTDDNWCLQSGADGTTIATVFDASTQEGMGSVTVGTWYYVCLATSGTTGTLYYKAATASTLTAQAVTSVTASVNAATLRIGESPWGGEWLNGCVADMKFWTTQLSAAEADLESRQYLPRRLTNLQAFYSLVKPETTDYSGNARTLSGGTGTATEDGPPIPWIGTSPRVVLPVAASGQVVLDGQGTAAASASGSIEVARTLSGTASAASSATGNLSVARPLTATAAAASSGSGDLTTQGQVDLSGTASMASGATGELTVTRAFTSVVSAAGGASGELAASRPLVAVVPAAAGFSGDLTTGPGSFVCQDFSAVATVDAHSGVATVDAHSGTLTIDAYSATYSIDAHSGTATICGR